MSAATNPVVDCAVGVLRLALAEAAAATAEIRSARDAPDNANYLLGTASAVEASLSHALDLVRAARAVLFGRRNDKE